MGSLLRENERPEVRLRPKAGIRGWRVGRDGLLRPLIVRNALSYWSKHDADIWVNQRLLVMHVLGSLRGCDKDTVRGVLDDLAAAGILLRKQLTHKRTIYRLCARFADPAAPGYAREIDELLVDPLPWVTADGRFFRLGAENGEGPTVYFVATYPHHFAKHLWMRAWIRAFDAGLLGQGAPGLAAVASAARRAPLRFLLRAWERREEGGAWSLAARALETSQLWRHARGAPGVADGAAGENDRAEEALWELHALCGHDHLRSFAPARGHKPRLPERWVYERLDEAVAALVEERAAHASADPSPPPIGLEERARIDPLLARLEQRVRTLGAELRGTLSDHRRAWPRGLFWWGR